MPGTRFIMVGGFLGAGKTTTLARLARRYAALGRRVGIVTNDQAQDLVDTQSLRAQGFDVAEVPGACFCCKFDELVGRTESLSEGDRPDVILAEPVGSCTDLVATVVQPMRDLYAGRFVVAPYTVLFKPSHGRKILKGLPGSGFSPKAAYIFRKQLEEADAIVLNRVDEMTTDEADEVAGLVADAFPGTPQLRLSAATGAGFDAYTELLEQDGAFGRKILDIDYDTYAAGEAELGWLNLQAALSGDRPFPLDELLLEVVRTVAERLSESGLEAAHLKVIGQEGGRFGVANLVSSDTGGVLSLPSGERVTRAELVVNARAAADPAQLEAEVRHTLVDVARTRELLLTVDRVQSFRPGRPTPTHRYAEPVG